MRLIVFTLGFMLASALISSRIARSEGELHVSRSELEKSIASATNRHGKKFDNWKAFTAREFPGSNGWSMFMKAVDECTAMDESAAGESEKLALTDILFSAYHPLRYDYGMEFEATSLDGLLTVSEPIFEQARSIAAYDNVYPDNLDVFLPSISTATAPRRLFLCLQNRILAKLALKHQPESILTECRTLHRLTRKVDWGVSILGWLMEGSCRSRSAATLLRVARELPAFREEILRMMVDHPLTSSRLGYKRLVILCAGTISHAKVVLNVKIEEVASDPNAGDVGAAAIFRAWRADVDAFGLLLDGVSEGASNFAKGSGVTELWKAYAVAVDDLDEVGKERLLEVARSLTLSDVADAMIRFEITVRHVAAKSGEFPSQDSLEKFAAEHECLRVETTASGIRVSLPAEHPLRRVGDNDQRQQPSALIEPWTTR